jgi:hypothetical protein
MADPHVASADAHMVGPHESPDDHGGDHGHDDHAHGGGEALGPIDVTAWGALLLGIALGLVVLFAMIQAVS